MDAIDRDIDSSIQLRSKKELIHGFISTINADTAVERDWQNFVISRKKRIWTLREPSVTSRKGNTPVDHSQGSYPFSYDLEMK